MESAEGDHKRKRNAINLDKSKRQGWQGRVGDKVDRLQLVGQGHHQQKTRPGKEEKRGAAQKGDLD